MVPIIAEKMAAVLNTICFKSPEGIGTPSLSGLFQPHLNLQEELHRKERRSYYDTFEWRCFEHQTAVVVKNRTISLLDLQSGVESAPLSLKTSPSHFLPSILPPGTIRNRLESLAGLRALMKRCTIESDMVAFRILDRIEKTTGFLFAETLFLIKGTRKERISGLITLKPLKGFHDDIFIISRALEEHFGTENRLDVKSVFRLLMDSAGLRVNDYNPKINLSLRPGNPVRISAAELLLFTHGIMKCNEPGILGNIDTEFLHDYRVALRRTR
ncbi:MAG: CHAD domain-containing protein, partial [Chlorobium limicola]|nr:CHAD domain-containing protein [Chlorobium limicola]